VITTVVDATMKMADAAQLGWRRDVEENCVTKRCLSSLKKLHDEYDPSTGVIPAWLAGEFHQAWGDLLVAGKRPQLTRNTAGWYVRGLKDGEAKGPAKPEVKKLGRVILHPFEVTDPQTLPRREYLYGRHFQRRIVSATVAPGGTGKTSLVMVESIAMATARNLLGEQPEARCRVWIHNGEDSRDELKRRVIAVCQYYGIPQEELVDWLFLTSGTEMPLKVANGYSDLKVDNELVEEMTNTILANEIDLVALDPLVTIHSVSENDNGKMDAVVRIFSRMSDICNCAIDLSQHTRKLAPGVQEHTADDARGASSVHDAVRAQRILHVMTADEARNNGIDEMDRRSYLRVDRTKGNTVPPARVATWRRFENVSLPNGDEVGVIVPCTIGEGAPSTEREAAAQRARDVYLGLLDRFTQEGEQ
jgi:AAA domain